MSISARLISHYRRRFGRYTVDDPRPIADQAPYTFYLPSENELLALAPGDLVKLIFQSHPPGAEWDVERMWVTVTLVSGDRFVGTLNNEPLDMPQIRHRSRIHFRRHNVIDIIWADDRCISPPPKPERRWYWERCMVDTCVTEGGVPVEYLYREVPDLQNEGDRYPDSGWRIRGDARNVLNDDLDNREAEYVALGRVLNTDDSWLSLIDEPVGSAFLRDWTTGSYIACERQQLSDG